ncbi:hypothetical protein NEOLI_000235 [Neolecta irregularis DAH-3]|uniref:ABM domain-containing protein n=1 Tax=Neolecta irregularis (strain DAH-3) TaxID=1198029 RepID=A0A1U7LIY8_NEOID|nr:hypothetical protein NEOLI_000235 [Neolecta irregularis DAH-3]|eukprot:OLL22609.1 hypothetical protein NEOLI_000235 [Neolecta irregularis DAH-3]
MTVTSIFQVSKETLSQEKIEQIANTCGQTRGLKYLAVADIHEKQETTALIGSWESMDDYLAWKPHPSCVNEESVVASFDTEKLKQWPVTDIAFLPMKSLSEFDAQREEIEAGLEMSSGHLGHECIIQDASQNTVLMLVGWETVEAHETFVVSPDSERYFQSLEKLLAVSNPKMYHLKNFKVLSP